MSYAEVTPASFGLEAPPPRPIGHETEYDILLPNGERGDWLAHTMQRWNLRQVGIAGHATRRGVWLENGAYAYPDVGHLEYCTPESLGPREATTTTHAAHILLGKLIDTSRKKYSLFRRSATIDPVTGLPLTKGYHENLCIPAGIANLETLEILESHLTTALYAWGGIVTMDGFNLSPKSLDIGRGIVAKLGGRITAGEKALGIIRTHREDSDTLHPSHGFARFEDRSKTPSSPWSDFMGAATTSIILRILEHPGALDKEGKDLRDLRLANSPSTFRQVATDMTLRTTHRLENGKRYSALDIQECLAVLALSTCERLGLPEDEQYAAQQWPIIHDDLRRFANGEADLSLVSDRIGWASKYVRLNRRLGEGALHSGTIKALTACLLWDRVVPHGAGQLHTARYEQQIFDPAALEYYAFNPPQQTRASVRAEYIRNARNIGEVTNMQWASVHVRPHQRDFGEPVERQALLHPFQTERIETSKLPAAGL